MTNQDWISVEDSLPDDGLEVMTIIDNDAGQRNEQTLVRYGNLWFVDTEKSMYVYYRPTHWSLL